MDKITEDKRSWNMSRIKSKNTRPELILRSKLHHLGYRYRIHFSVLPGSPDIVFSKRKKVLFVHGCYWHRHPGCKNVSIPKSRVQKWNKKFEENINRDRRNQNEIRELGWDYLIVWECELEKKQLTQTLHRVTSFVGPTG